MNYAMVFARLQAYSVSPETCTLNACAIVCHLSTREVKLHSVAVCQYVYVHLKIKAQLYVYRQVETAKS